jgi:soluble lytic murein transglycosylase-like protein
MEGAIKTNALSIGDLSIRVSVTCLIIAVLISMFELKGASALGFGTLDEGATISVGENRIFTYTFPESEVKEVRRIVGRFSALPSSERELLQKEILEAAYVEKMDPSLVASVVAAESSFNKKAISPMGAVGLMQLIPSTAKYVAAKHGMTSPSREDLFRPEVNLRLGAKYLKELLHKFKNHEQALHAYNWGPTNVLLKPAKVPASSKLYAKKILAQAGNIG